MPDTEVYECIYKSEYDLLEYPPWEKNQELDITVDIQSLSS